MLDSCAAGIAVVNFDNGFGAAMFAVEIEGVTLRIKVGRFGDDIVNVAPEHDDDARTAAARLRIPLKEVYERALTAARAPL